MEENQDEDRSMKLIEFIGVSTFHFKQFNLPVDSAGITGHTAVCANDPMARYDVRNGL